MPKRRRAQHRKSRRGCLQCKQRHIKCDETQPECVNCAVVGRQCRYAEVQIDSRGPSRTRSASQVPPPGPTVALVGSPNVDHSSPASSSSTAAGHLTANTANPAATPVSPAFSYYSAPGQLTHASPRGPRNEDVRMTNFSRHSNASSTIDGVQLSSPKDMRASMDHEVNIDHMELVIHFSLSKAAGFSGSELLGDLLDLGTNVILQKSLGNSCLLYQMLAISARHLSFQHPDRHEYYSRQSMQLQTRAIELFNTTSTLDESNCEAMILFSSLLNRQVLADALSNREGNFLAFLGRLIQTAQLQKGIRVVSDETWPMLLKSDLSPLLKWGDRHSLNRAALGKHCEVLRQLIPLSPTLDPVSKEACRSAAHFLQIGFDNIENPTHCYAYSMIYSWLVVIPKEFFDLLTQRQPEAVAILGFYAVLLHLGRQNWVIGDSGAFLIQSVSNYLGPEWAHWLEWPLSQFSETSAS